MSSVPPRIFTGLPMREKNAAAARAGKSAVSFTMRLLRRCQCRRCPHASSRVCRCARRTPPPPVPGSRQSRSPCACCEGVNVVGAPAHLQESADAREERRRRPCREVGSLVHHALVAKVSMSSVPSRMFTGLPMREKTAAAARAGKSAVSFTMRLLRMVVSLRCEEFM